MNKVKWGLIGCGDIAQKRVAPALRDLAGSELVAVTRARPELVESFAKAFGAELQLLHAYSLPVFFASDNGASAEIMVRNGGHDPTAPPGSAKSYLCLGPGFSTACNTPFRRHKTWVHEGGISTPLIVHWPAGISANGELRHTPGHVVDIVPTVLELAGAQKPKEWNGEPIPEAPGRSLVPAFARDVTIPHESLWWLHEGHRAVRVGDWKLVAAKGDPWALYDLRTDRAEQNDLAGGAPAHGRPGRGGCARRWDRTSTSASTCTGATTRSPASRWRSASSP